MPNLSLAQVFGEGAFQDSSVLIIQKASLLGFTPITNNTAESLLAAILVTALSAFSGVITDDGNNSITDEINNSITFDNSEAFELLKMLPWQAFQNTRNNAKYINNQIIIQQYSVYVTN